MTDQVTVEVMPPFERVSKAISLIKLGAALQKAIENMGFGVERFAKQETPVDTGRLRASISTDIGTLYARVHPNVAYAGWIHDGKMTRNGQTIYIRGRGRAGTPPGGKPFMKLGLDKAKDKFGDKEILKEVDLEISRGLSAI